MYSWHVFKSNVFFQGSVTASVTTIDFDDVDSVLSAPGDLTVLDQEGETQPLTTYGILPFSQVIIYIAISPTCKIYM